jgi:hypothetical protein
MDNFDRLHWIVEELWNQAMKEKNKDKFSAYGKVLDEMNDLEKKYPKEDKHDPS